MVDIISQLDEITPDTWKKSENEYKEALESLPSWTKIPLINSNPLHNLRDNRLARFRGMIQDMHNPEFYCENVEAIDTVNNSVRIKCGKFRERIDIQDNEKVNYASNLLTSQRQPFVVVSIPGLNKWAKKVEDDENILPELSQQPNTSRRVTKARNGAEFKRTFDSIDDSDHISSSDILVASTKEKRTEDVSMDENTPALSKEHILNFPLPDVPSQSCLVKVYDDNEDLKLNNMIEIVGFLDMDPILSAEFASSTDPGEEPLDVETLTHNPPPSLVPRLHAVCIRKLEHCNPLIKEPLNTDEVLSEANRARENLKRALTELLLGDSLAADYLICNMISSVYLREDGLALGAYSVNISHIPVEKYPNYTTQLYNILQQIMTKSYYFLMTLDSMNTCTMLPKKDYESNRLTSGILQLTKETYLVIDETQMSAGQLSATGVANYDALSQLIKDQKVQYDFKFYKMDFNSDVPVLVLSSGQSLLPSQAMVPLQPDEQSFPIFNEIYEAASYYLRDGVLDAIRAFLTLIRQIHYTISEDHRYIEDDFIEMKQRSNQALSADDLHRMLVLARLVSLAHGHDTLTRECWERTKEMEQERLARVLKLRKPRLSQPSVI